MNTYYIIILYFSITMVFFLLGYSAVFDMMDKYGNINIDNLPSLAGKYMSEWGGWLFVGGLITVGTLLSGLNFIALLPLVFGYILFDMITFPTGLFEILPYPINFLLIIFFRLLQFLIFISFVRSGN
jgi:hypothetical protein